MLTTPNWKLLDLPIIKEPRGNLTFVEGCGRHLPFDIKRMYYLYDIPTDAERGAHGHKKLQQLILAISGSFEILLDNGSVKEVFHLRKPWQGLYIQEGTWREIRNFSAGAVCVVLASDYYDEEDYLRDYDSFLNFVGSKKACENAEMIS